MYAKLLVVYTQRGARTVSRKEDSEILVSEFQKLKGRQCHRMTTCAARRNETTHQVTNAMDNVHRKNVSICCARKSGCDQFTTRCLQPCAESLDFEKVTIPCDPENAAKDDAMRVMRDIPNEPKKQQLAMAWLGDSFRLLKEWREPGGEQLSTSMAFLLGLCHLLVAWVVQHVAWTHD